MGGRARGVGWGGLWHNALVLVFRLLAAPMGLSPRPPLAPPLCTPLELSQRLVVPVGPQDCPCFTAP